MITIEFYRYIATPEVAYEGQQLKNVFHTIQHQVVCHSRSQLDYTRAFRIIAKFLKSHYGKCILYSQNQNELDHPLEDIFCNAEQMEKDMTKLGILIIIKEYNKNGNLLDDTNKD